MNLYLIKTTFYGQIELEQLSPNSCSSSDIVINRLHKLIKQEQKSNFKITFFYLYGAGTIALFCGTVIKTDLMNFLYS